MITTTEGREELRRLLDERVWQLPYLQTIKAPIEEYKSALDGLDIAEEIVKWLKGEEVEPNAWLADLIRKWDTWKEKR